MAPSIRTFRMLGSHHNRTEMLRAEDRIQLNRWAAAPEHKSGASTWFEAKSREVWADILRETGMMAVQAGCKPSDVDAACLLFQLKASWTPCVLMGKGSPKSQLAKVLGLPDSEARRGFMLLLGLLAIADRRRRNTRCRGQCTHWWHRDLEDEGVRRSILESGEAGRANP